MVDLSMDSPKVLYKVVHTIHVLQGWYRSMFLNTCVALVGAFSLLYFGGRLANIENSSGMIHIGIRFHKMFKKSVLSLLIFEP